MVLSFSLNNEEGIIPPCASDQKTAHSPPHLFSGSHLWTGTTGSVVKMRLPASSSTATPVNRPGAAQRTDPAKSDVSVRVNTSSMNRASCPLGASSGKWTGTTGSVVEGGGLPTKGRLRSSVQLHQRASVRYVACLIHV